MTGDEFALAHHLTPEAGDLIAIDFDGTLYPFVGLMAAPKPMPGAVDAIKRLRAKGFRIALLTSRLSPIWLDESHNNVDDQRAYITRLLERDGIRGCIDIITAEKLPARWYIDDRGIQFGNDWRALCDFLVWESEHTLEVHS